MVGMSHCEGACAGAWPPLLAPKDAKAPKDWSKVERADGAYQWAFQEHPLYTTTRTGDALAAALGPDGAWSPARLSPPK
jgi:predicted lipoprotein with Yx(FWY)xxD motif